MKTPKQIPEMSVKLNFATPNESSLANDSVNFSLIRQYHPTGVNEYFYNEEPLTREEYATKLTRLNLHIQNFCAYQGKLEEICFKEGKGLTTLIEELSGSIRFKPKYDELKKAISECDERIKDQAELLH